MFDKIRFAKIIKEISETYESQRIFSKESGINRTYISGYMNLKIDNPPLPPTLKRLANASHGKTSYSELMDICGHIDLKTVFLHSSNGDETNLSYWNKEDLKEKGFKTEDLIRLEELVNSSTIDDDTKSKEISRILDSYPNNISTALYDLAIAQTKVFKNQKISPNLCMCPLYGEISAGLPNWAEENLEGYLPLDPELMGIINPEEYYFLRVNGESMNKVVKNGAFALIHKQDTVNNGEIAVVLVNGDNATLKQFSRQGDIIVLTPESTDDSFEQQIYTKETRIQVIGKYVGKMEFNK